MAGGQSKADRMEAIRRNSGQRIRTEIALAD